MTDDQVLALLAGLMSNDRVTAGDLLIWAKTEGMADVDRAVREWHDAKLAKERPECRECDGRGCIRYTVNGWPESAPCSACGGSGTEGGPTYEENHIGVPDGLPRT